MDLLEESGNAHDAGGMDLLEILNDLGEVFGKVDLHPVKHGGVVAHGSLEGVGQRQEREERELVGPLEQIRVDVVYLLGVGEEVVVGEHDAFGSAGCAGGVDDRGHILALDSPDPFVELFGLRVLGPFLQRRAQLDHAVNGLLERIETDDVPQVGKLGFDRDDLVGMRLSRGEAHDGVRIVDDVSGFFRRVRCVDGYVDRADRENRQVGDPPLVAVGGEQRHLVAGLDALADEEIAQVSDHFVHLFPRDVRVDAIFLVRDDGSIPELLHPVLEARRDRSFRKLCHDTLLIHDRYVQLLDDTCIYLHSILHEYIEINQFFFKDISKHSFTLSA